MPSLPYQVNKQTSMDGLPHSSSVVRPKERRHDVHQQNPFMRGNTIIRSKTFSPGPQSQYICRVRTQIHTHKYMYILIVVLELSFFYQYPHSSRHQINRSDSDSSTLSKKSPFVRNASERRSVRMKKVTKILTLTSTHLGNKLYYLKFAVNCHCKYKPCLFSLVSDRPVSVL